MIAGLSMIEASTAHASLLSVMHIDAFQASNEPGWSEVSIKETLEVLGTRAAIAMIGDTPAGFGLIRTIFGESEILTLCTLPDQQSKGVGRYVAEALIRWHREADGRKLFLEVRSDNEAAIRLYQGLGFQQSGQRPTYFKMLDGTHRDALIMRLS